MEGAGNKSVAFPTSSILLCSMKLVYAPCLNSTLKDSQSAAVLTRLSRYSHPIVLD
jgi:hypothetical protein